ncbi:MAG: mannitol-1-phosphate 5-dehydrogenase [Treponemataceae bacterium]
MKAIVFGAGNIGRAFIGRLFSENGASTVFVDVRADIVSELNRRREYPIVVKDTGKPDRTIIVGNVGGLLAGDAAGVRAALVEADFVATCVGLRALPYIAPDLADGLRARWKFSGRPLDLILAENVHDGDALLRGLLKPLLPADFPLERALGVSRAAVGKMVPVMTAEEVARDPLAVFSEGFNRLVVDGRAFRTKIPPFADLQAVDDIDAFMDRKLYLHNLGHAAVAYFGHAVRPDERYVSGAVGIQEVSTRVRETMACASEILFRAHPAAFTRLELDAHANDLLARFANVGLKDTVHRVGRDLRRKLSREDRVLGAVRLAESLGVDWTPIARTFFAALRFGAADERGAPAPDDAAFLTDARASEIGDILVRLCGMDAREDASCIEKFIALDRELRPGAGRT